MSEPFIGEIKMYSFDFAPKNYAFCDGQIMAISQNQALFSLLGVQYGGNGTSTFALPNLQSRAPLHFNGSYSLGQAAGAETVTLTPGEMAAHNHVVAASTDQATVKSPSNAMFAADTSPDADFFAPYANTVPLAGQSMSNAGGSQPHNNVQPFLTINFCIALYGLYPSRN